MPGGTRIRFVLLEQRQSADMDIPRPRMTCKDKAGKGWMGMAGNGCWRELLDNVMESKVGIVKREVW